MTEDMSRAKVLKVYPEAFESQLGMGIYNMPRGMAERDGVGHRIIGEDWKDAASRLKAEPVEQMSEDQLDAELRANGIDPHELNKKMLARIRDEKATGKSGARLDEAERAFEAAVKEADGGGVGQPDQAPYFRYCAQVMHGVGHCHFQYCHKGPHSWEPKEAAPVRCHCGTDVCVGVDHIPAGVFCARGKEAAPEVAGGVSDYQRGFAAGVEAEYLAAKVSRDIAEHNPPILATEGAPETIREPHNCSRCGAECRCLLSENSCWHECGPCDCSHDIDDHEKADSYGHEPCSKCPCDKYQVAELKAEGAEKAPERPKPEYLKQFATTLTSLKYVQYSEFERYVNALESRNVPFDDTLEAMVRDFTEAGSRPKSEVRRRILAFADRKRDGMPEALVTGEEPDRFDDDWDNGGGFDVAGK